MDDGTYSFGLDIDCYAIGANRDTINQQTCDAALFNREQGSPECIEIA